MIENSFLLCDSQVWMGLVTGSGDWHQALSRSAGCTLTSPFTDAILPFSQNCRGLAMTITHFPPAERKRNLDLNLFQQRTLCHPQLLSARAPQGTREGWR